ncbi:uncharacterized protein LOC131009068 [Salvia miltiorrhiza]|uniref:uncharacterized protein LOC131009068 n=1 Tax=Salvia miltiorrhiza TaxID=226208 RepID=UPI0025ACB69D|nr:uncharacterized protein LOC131009068 [Salvia miltiorrhiza]XP_057792249.1 uncharacterized protein LOC131009068 [Salvia miltiorrhiza]
MATAATTGGPNHVAREARRRRIIERGSDRLALISGRIQSLPPDPDQSISSTSSPAQIPATDSSPHEDAASNSLLPNEESVQEQGPNHAVSDLAVEPPQLNSYNAGSSPSRSLEPLHDTNEESSQIPSSDNRPAQDRQLEQTHHSLFTPGQIRSAVAASENTRMFCSIAAAVLVIASYMGLPVGGFRGIILLRPFYLLLLTNMTIVLGRLILGARGIDSRTGRRRSSAPTAGGNDLADQLGRALELGLLMQKVLGAVSMDFTIYAVVLVCGLSLVQKLG